MDNLRYYKEQGNNKEIKSKGSRICFDGKTFKSLYF